MPITRTILPQILLINDFFSSILWAISVPNRNSEVKSLLWPTGPPTEWSQNKGYRHYLIKITGKLEFYTKFGKHLLSFGIQFVFIQLLCFEGFQNCIEGGFKHISIPRNLIWRNKFRSKYWKVVSIPYFEFLFWVALLAIILYTISWFFNTWNYTSR